MEFEIFTIGDEVLAGQTLNTNARFLGNALAEEGYSISRQSVLPDRAEVIQSALLEAFSRGSFVITTGGLGPTVDDLTKEVAANLFERPLELDDSLHRRLLERYSDSAATRKQAAMPKGARVLKNLVGSAPGLFFSAHKTLGPLLLLPGPPREMEPMFLNEAIPLLKEQVPTERVCVRESLGLCLLREADLDPLLREIKEEHRDAEIGIYPSYGTLRVTFRVVERPERLKEWVEKVEKAFPLRSFREESIEKALASLLLGRKETLALAESCTGGAMSERLTAMADASRYLLGSLVVYSNAWKESFLGVSSKTIENQGAVSQEAVVEMVEGLLQKTKADYAVAVSGIAGPSGGSIDKPVGTIYLALAKRGEAVDAGKIFAPPHRASAIEYGVQAALGGLYRKIAYNCSVFS